MRILIVGAGEVGFHIAEILSVEGHHVALIDKDPELARQASEQLDAMVVVGNGASKRTLQDAQVARADILIAVTDIDEVNMIACMAAKHVGVPTTMARIRNPDYLEEAASVSREFTGIDYVIQPEAAVADEIARIAELPGALEAGTFAGEQVSMVEVSVDPQSRAAGKRLLDIGLPRNVLLSAILRPSGLSIPDGNTVLLPHDRAFVVGKRAGVLEVASLLSLQMRPPRSAMLLGCGQLGMRIAETLEGKGLRLVVFEKDRARAVDAAERLRHALVIHDEGLSEDILRAEGAADTDLFITATGDDRVNILASLQAKRLGVGRTIAIVERAEFSSVLESIGIDVAISPRRLTASIILRFIRGRDVLSVAVLERAAGEALEFIVSDGSAVAGRPLKDVGFPAQSIVGVFVRDGEVHVAHGASVLLPGDKAIVFAVPRALPELERLFAH